MPCVIVSQNTGIRVRIKDRLTPFFDRKKQAEKYIEKMMDGNPNIMIEEV